MQTQQSPAPGGAQAQQLSPQQLKQMQLVSKQAMTVLLEDKAAENIVARAKADDPAKVVAEVTTQVLHQIHQAAARAGQNVDMVTMMVAGVQIVSTLAQMLVAGDVLQEEQLPQFVPQACRMAVEMHNAAAGGQGAA
jgi:hypothetical protein